MALPLYPQLKQSLEEAFLELMEHASRKELGPFNESPRFVQHEGASHTYTTVHGEQRSTDYQDMMVEFSVSGSDLRGMNLEDVVRLLSEKGREMGARQARYHFGVLDKITKETGNVVDGQGQPITLSLLLDTIDKLHISFDDSGNPTKPTIVVPPKLEPRMRELMREAETDEDAKARLEEIIKRKREEWDEEQDRRKLVD